MRRKNSNPPGDNRRYDRSYHKKCKTKTMHINSTNEPPIKLDIEGIEKVATFTYLGSVIAVDGGTEMVGIGKARTAFLMLRPE